MPKHLRPALLPALRAPLLTPAMLAAVPSTDVLSTLLALLRGSAKSGLWDFTDPATLRQKSDGTGAVTATSPVGLAYNLSEGGVNLAQATDANRPLWTANGLSFDGDNDLLGTALAGTSSVYVGGAIKTPDTNFVAFSGGAAGGFPFAFEGDTSKNLGSGSPTIDGVLYQSGQSTTRDDLAELLSDNQWHSVVLDGTNTSTWTRFDIGRHSQGGNYFSGTIRRAVYIDLTAVDAAAIALAARWLTDGV